MRITIKFGLNRLQFKSPFCQRNRFITKSSLTVIGQNTYLPITTVSAVGFYKAAKHKNSQVFEVSVLEINSLLEQQENKTLAKRKVHGIPDAYSRYHCMFEEDMAKHLLPHRPMNLKIDLKEGAQAPFRRLFNMSVDELKVLKTYISENIDRGFIRVSSSSAA